MVDFKKLLDELHQEKQKRLYDDVLCGKCGDVVLHEKIGDKWKCCHCEDYINDI